MTGFCRPSESGKSKTCRREADSGVAALATSDSFLFAGTRNAVWRRPLSEMIISVEPVTSELPLDLSLSHNYPNPFNPTTTIASELPRTSSVSLCVYDVLGREVATLLNDEKSTGTYTLQWDASGVSSGVYFYRMRAGDFVQTRRMMVVK